MDLLTHTRRMFDYDRWANARVNASLVSAQEALELGPGGAAAEVPALIKARQIWSHVQWARRLWLSRLGRAEPPDGEGMFPSWSVERVARECAVLDTLWREFTDQLAAADLDRITAFRSTEGKDVSNAIGDILVHVVNHSTYHRGQIARLVAECGGQVAVTDFVVYARTNPPPRAGGA